MSRLKYQVEANSDILRFWLKLFNYYFSPKSVNSVPYLEDYSHKSKENVQKKFGYLKVFVLFRGVC